MIVNKEKTKRTISKHREERHQLKDKRYRKKKV